MGMTISSAFGNNPTELTLETGAIGISTAIVLLSLLFFLVYLIGFFAQKNKRK